MNTRGRRTGAALAATGLVLAVTAGLGGAAAAPVANEGAAGTATAGGSAVTLITGDEVLLDANGSVSAVIRAEGREHVPVRVFERDGATLVVPWDAQALIDEGTVDEGLFNVTELSRAAYDAFAGVPVIVAYDEGSRALANTLRADAGVEVRDRFDALAADALTVPEDSAAPLWDTLTRVPGEDRTTRSAAPGVRAVSLDRIRQPTLDGSTAQVGADQAWAAGYDGSGVTIAVLDTGIDAAHGDFEDKIRATANFTDENADDVNGHGTHVASTAAGTGDRSGGSFRGVAPGADLLAGKVLGAGGGLDSWIIAGMEWAVDEGADIVNMSLGGAAPQGHDPLVEAVDALSEEHGTLFVISAGNSGPDAGTVGSPGVAPSALTVGAVDDADAMADFSSAGPSPADGALKPDLSAPGVEIGAAVPAGSDVELTGTPVADGYAGISGTSMAAPHVAGAAALLLERYPDWTGEQLKTALVGSAAEVEAAPLRTGTGRLDVVRALEQTLTADSHALDFGSLAPPWGGADRITREITYRNQGAEDVVLELAASTTGPGGGAAPDGLFSLAAETVTVPAGGTAAVEVVADPAAVVASGEGHYGLVVTGTSGDQRVRTAGTLAFEPEQFDVTVEITGRDGAPAEGARAFVVGQEAGFNALSEGGTATGQVTAGDYLVEVVAPDPWGEGSGGSVEWAVAPRLTVDGPTTLEVDLREAERLDFTAPDPEAEPRELATTYESPGVSGWMWYFGAPPDGVNSLSIADPPAGDPFRVSLLSHHAGADGQQYLGHREVEGAFPTGLVNHPGPSDLAHVAATVGTRAEGAGGWVGAAPETFGLGIGTAVGLPGTADFHLQSGTSWRLSSSQYDAEGVTVQSAMYPPEEFPPGETSERTLNAGVFGPAYPNGAAFFREGNLLFGDLSLFTPGTGESGWGESGSGSTRVYRDGELLRDLDVSAAGLAVGLAEGQAEYRIVSTASRADLGYTDTSTRVTVDYTVTSATTEAYEPVAGPLAVRYAPALAPDSTAPAGAADFAVPVAVEGGTAVSLTVETSTDGGESWTVVHEGAGDVPAVAVDNPAADGSVSLRATAVDADGNRTVQTVIDAYRTA